jgi:hypothetical protein
MAIISRSTTWSDGQTLTASALNGEFNVIQNDYNGNITNANIAASAGITDSKLATISTAGKVNISAFTVASQSQGDIIYASSATGWVRLAAGTSGQFLQTQGGSANPIWASGATVNMGRTSTNSEFTTTSISWVDVTNYSVTITTTVASDIIIDIMCDYQKNTTTGGGQNQYQVLQGGSIVGTTVYKTSGGNNFNESVFIRRTVKNLAAGTYTFKLQAQNTNAGTLTFGTGEMIVLSKATG